MKCKPLLFFATFFVSAFAECPDSRIINGQTTDIRQVPYQLALLRQGTLSSFCGAVVINRKTVLTTAHCVDGLKAKEVRVRAGSTKDFIGGVTQQVKKIIIHEEYYKDHLYNVALLILTKEFHFGDLIKKIPLADIEPEAGNLARVSGWGFTKPTSVRPLALQSARVTIISLPKCRQMGLPVQIGMICAGDCWNGRTHCVGDDGGPLTFDKKLIGIVSWGGCDESKPGVYVSIPYFYDWIYEKMIQEEEDLLLNYFIKKNNTRK